MNKTELACRDCESGVYEVRYHSVVAPHNGKSMSINNLQYYHCSNCDSELITPKMSRANDKLICDTKRAHLGYLISDQIRELRLSLKLTQAQASKAFGGGLNSFSKYERGEVIQNGSMDKLMRMVLRKPSRILELMDSSKSKIELSIGGDNWRWQSGNDNSRSPMKIVVNNGSKPAKRTKIRRKSNAKSIAA